MPNSIRFDSSDLALIENALRHFKKQLEEDAKSVKENRRTSEAIAKNIVRSEEIADILQPLSCATLEFSE